MRRCGRAVGLQPVAGSLIAVVLIAIWENAFRGGLPAAYDWDIRLLQFMRIEVILLPDEAIIACIRSTIASCDVF
jgi:hypothetical protein